MNSQSQSCKACCNNKSSNTSATMSCQTSICSSDNKPVDSKSIVVSKCQKKCIASSVNNESRDSRSSSKCQKKCIASSVNNESGDSRSSSKCQKKCIASSVNNESRSSKCLPFYRKSSKNISLSCSTLIRTLQQQPPRGKRALLCGVSYKSNKNNKLKGTIQDVINMKKLLSHKFGFPDNAFLILGEDDEHEKPTRNNITEAFKWLMEDLHNGDSLVFYFSGHGIRQHNLDEDEVDGFDEAICPVDFETSGMIVDNEINEMIVAPLKEGVTLHAIVDTCHSGTLLDLPYVYNRTKVIWDPPSRVCKGTSGGQAICISACEDYQLATDTSMLSSDRRMAGAMTQTLIRAVSGKQEITYQELLEMMSRGIQEANKSITKGIKRMFHSQMLQDPMLSSSKPFSIDKVFTL